MICLANFTIIYHREPWVGYVDPIFEHMLNMFLIVSFFQIASVGIFCNWALLGSPGLSYALLFPNHPVALISKKPNWNSKFLMKKGVPDNFSN